MSQRLISAFGILLFTTGAFAGEYLVKLKNIDASSKAQFEARHTGSLESVSIPGKLFLWKANDAQVLSARQDANVVFLEKNGRIANYPIPGLKEVPERDSVRASDNPDIQSAEDIDEGADPLIEKSWALKSVKAATSWKVAGKGEDVIVAVTDTGVDYNHEDLIQNMWRNPKEIPGDGIDNDENGYVDDIVGWDFHSDDNKPYDYIRTKFTNPGHGTHCAGVIGATHQNSIGTSGVAPRVRIMALRFISEGGQGTNANAVRAIDYAIENGARVISASWGTLGEDDDSEALKEALQRAKDADVLFVAAAGNGRNGAGFSNDDDDKPAYPASYDFENIISVAALDEKDELGKFSNWGINSVDIGAPGVQVFSTVPENKYQDKIFSFPKVTWDGTSMAAPHVSGAAAAVWSLYPEKTGAEIKAMILDAAVAIPALKGKVSSGGRLDFESILK